MTQHSPGNSGAMGSIIAYIDSDLEELIPEFLENRRNDTAAMRGAAEVGDFETIRVLGHDMKGCGAGYGFDGITNLGESLEQAAKDQNKPEIRDLVQELNDYLEIVEVVYE